MQKVTMQRKKTNYVQKEGRKYLKGGLHRGRTVVVLGRESERPNKADVIQRTKGSQGTSSVNTWGKEFGLEGSAREKLQGDRCLVLARKGKDTSAGGVIGMGRDDATEIIYRGVCRCILVIL